MEAGIFNATTVICGQLGPVALASHSVLLTTHNLTFLAFPYAISCAASIRHGFLRSSCLLAVPSGSVHNITHSQLHMRTRSVLSVVCVQLRT
jgi:hypothetical protein